MVQKTVPSKSKSATKGAGGKASAGAAKRPGPGKSGSRPPRRATPSKQARPGGSRKGPKATSARPSGRRSSGAASKGTKRAAARPSRPSPSPQAKAQVDRTWLEELVLQALETEKGGMEVYKAALECAMDDRLRKEWQEYLEQTTHHADVARRLCQDLGVDPSRQTPGRMVVRQLGECLVAAMRQARSEGGDHAQLVATECVVLAETKDHQNWQLLGAVAKAMDGDEAEALRAAVEEVEDDEDEHLYHTMGWSRELWLSTLGLPAVLPPPEEKKDVKTAIGAARARKARSKMAHRR